MATLDNLARIIQSSLSVIHAQTSSNQARTSAQEALDQALSNEQNLTLVIPACLQLLQGSGDATSCHFALSTISKYIRQRSDNLSANEWNGLKGGLLALFQGSINLPFFVMSKLIDVICDVAIRTWPNDWPELLEATLAINTGWALCLFARICDCLSVDSLSVRCVAPERQLALRNGLASISDLLSRTCSEFVQTPLGSQSPQLQWVIELINGMANATKQSSHLIRFSLHQLVLNAYISSTDAPLKMLCTETLSSFVQYLNGQGGRSYTVTRATREQDLSLLEGIIKVAHYLMQPEMIRKYCEDEEFRDPVKAFADLLTDIRRTSNIFSYFSSLEPFANVLIEAASIHPSLCIQIIAMTNIDALLRMKNIAADRRSFILCYLACHDFYTPTDLRTAPIPNTAMFPHIAIPEEVARRRTLCIEEAEEEDMRPNELVGKLKNAALLCLRHITTMGITENALIEFVKEILSESIKPGVGVTSSYFPSLLFTEVVATSLSTNDTKSGDISSIVDIVSFTCPPDDEQNYLWFLGKTGSFISEGNLKEVFTKLLNMDIAHKFPVQVAFISLCKTNRNSYKFANELHQALQVKLNGESRSWAVGAILTASSHGGVGAADGYATTVYTDMKAKLESIASSTSESVEEFAKASSPIFLTMKAILEVPLSTTVSGHISGELAASILPFCWSRLFQDSSVFGLGPNEFLSVVGSQFAQVAPVGPTTQFNSCFQLYLSLTQVAGLCLPLIPDITSQGTQAIESLFNPGWKLRPSLLNILITNVASPAGHTKPTIALRSLLPQAMISLQNGIDTCTNDDFTVNSISRASVAVVQTVLNALKIATDDEFTVTEFTGVSKPILTQKQVTAQRRSKNRFASIAEDAQSTQSQHTGGPKIPYELLSDPGATLQIVGRCLTFRSDKALRRISQTIPTIVTRWWNSCSNNAELAAKFIQVLPSLLTPIIAVLSDVRTKHPSTIQGGPLYSYAIERAVSGRKLTSELVDHATISIHGVLCVFWRFATAGKPLAHTLDPIAVVSSCPSFSEAIRLLLEARHVVATEASVLELVNCGKEQTLESRVALKYFVHSMSAGENNEIVSAPVSGAIRATSSDINSTGVSRANSTQVEDASPPGNLFH